MTYKTLLSSFLIMIALSTSGCFWQNVPGNQQVNPKVLLEPENAAELIQAVQEAEQRKLNVKMTGSGHSLSDVAVTQGMLLTPYKLNKALNLDTARLKAADHTLFARVQSGMRIRELNTYLDNRGLALKNMGGWDEQTIVGAAMTSTHGSGLNYGPMSAQIVSMQVVTQGGKMLQLEPSNGITDAHNFPGQLEENPSIDVELIQDDDTFNAFTVSIGSMGIVYAVILQTDQKFWLHEERHIAKWSEVKASGGILEQMMTNNFNESPAPDYFELQYNPYPSNGDYNVLVTKRYRSSTPLSADSSRGQFGSMFGSWLITQLETPLAAILAGAVELAGPIIDLALNAQVDQSYNNISYKVFNIGVVNETDAVGIETAFDVSQTIEAIEYQMELAANLKEQRKVLTAPVAVRFVKAADAMIATQQGRNTVFLEQIILDRFHYTESMFAVYQNAFIEKFSARPHWGLDWDSQQGTATFSQVFPRWDEWMRYYNQYNSKGTFNGWVTDRLGISNTKYTNN